MSVNYSFSSAVEQTTPPPIPKAWGWRDTYLADPIEGPVVDLSQGVPGTAPHPSILDALSETAKLGNVAKYGPILGAPDLREAVAEELRVLYRLKSGKEVTGSDVAITAGGNMAFLVILMALCPPNTSSVLIPMPAYFSHAMSLSLQSIKPIHLACDPDNNFYPSLSAAREYLEFSKSSNDPIKPRMILLINPSNPTGSIMSFEMIREWYTLAKEHKVALVMDETYRDFAVGEDDNIRGVPHRLFEEEDWRSTFISLGSFSKSYRIPGYRLGTITGSPLLLRQLETICDCVQICAPRIAQVALAPLLPSLRPDLLSASRALAARRTLFSEIIASVPGWKVVSSGGYFAYVSFPSDYLSASSALGLKRKSLGSEDIAKGLAVKVGVVVLPGSFSMPDLEDDEVWEDVRGGQKLREDRWLRFAVANVNEETIMQVGPRLRRFNEIMGMA